MTRPAHAETDAEIAGERPHHGRRNAVHAHLALLVVKEQFVLLFRKFLRPSPRTDDDSEAAEFVDRQASRVNAGSSERFARSRDRQREDARDVSAVLLVHPCKFIEACDLAGNLNVEFTGIKTRYTAHAAAS